MNPYVIAGLGLGGLALLVSSDAKASVEPLLNFEPDYTPLIGYESDDFMLQHDLNLQAYLAVLRAGESGGDYQALYGGGRFRSFADHPTFTEGFEGARTSAGPTHAAGAYQFQPGTWKEAQKALNLPDFSPSSQDQAAVFLIKRRGAYSAVLEGETAVAQTLLRNEWASLNDRGLGWVNSVFTANGGAIA